MKNSRLLEPETRMAHLLNPLKHIDQRIYQTEINRFWRIFRLNNNAVLALQHETEKIKSICKQMIIGFDIKSFSHRFNVRCTIFAIYHLGEGTLGYSLPLTTIRTITNSMSMIASVVKPRYA